VFTTMPQTMSAPVDKRGSRRMKRPVIHAAVPAAPSAT
jgi:hypothetical protein